MTVTASKDWENMTQAQVATTVLTGVLIVAGAALVGMSDFVFARVVGTAMAVLAALGYITLLGMIVSDRRQ